MSFACAPAQLPIAPRPVPSELFSSWILRVASGNCISLRELLEAVESIYPEAHAIESLDLSLPPSFLRALSRFCRVPVRTLQALDLRQRVPHLEKALLLKVLRRRSIFFPAKGVSRWLCILPLMHRESGRGPCALGMVLCFRNSLQRSPYSIATRLPRLRRERSSQLRFLGTEANSKLLGVRRISRRPRGKLFQCSRT